MGLSNQLITFLNFFTALLSVPIVVTGIWLASKSSSSTSACLHFLQWPLILIGIFILLVSMAGLLGISCRILCLFWLYLACIMLLILLLAAFTAFAFLVTNRSSGGSVARSAEYHLANYSSWLQRQVNQSSHWEKIKSCLSDAHVCNSGRLQSNNYSNASNFFTTAHLSALQSGCCKPPSACDFTFVDATQWVQAKNPGADSDCLAWTNDPNGLCFSCNSCKAGVLEIVMKDWRKVATINVVILVLMIAVYSIGCCAFRNVRRDDFYK